jgi:DNA-binding NarL/FixJ family response regulator
MRQGEESILIVARPERLREALRVLLTPVPRLDTIRAVDNVPSALKTVSEQAPRLVLLDANLSDTEVKAALKQIKMEQPETHCIVLAHSVRQEQMARLAGADDVLLRGRPTAGLLNTVTKLLLTPKNQ